jgi:hypothetical protein
MKTSITILRSSLFLLALTVVSNSHAKGLAKIHALKGKGFVVYSDGKTAEIKPQTELTTDSQLMLEEGSEASIHDYFDRSFFVTGGSHLVFKNNQLEISKGTVWVKNLKANSFQNITTPNSWIQMGEGECVVSIDPNQNISNVFVVGGNADVASLEDRTFKFSLTAGTFTEIDPKIDQGLPRTPVRISADSLNQIASQFTLLKSNNEKTLKPEAPNRAIASVPVVSVDKPEQKIGEVIYIKTVMPRSAKREIASVKDGDALKYFGKLTKPKKLKLPKAPIKIFGLSARQPASAIVEKNIIQEVKNVSVPKHDEYFKSYQNHQNEQPIHRQEVQRLMEDLKSF